MNRNALLALAISALFCGAAQAQDEGERLPPPQSDSSDEPVFMATQLKDSCQPPANADAAAKAAAGKVCDSYLRGMADGLFMVGALDASHIELCVPQDGPLALEDVKQEFQKYIKDHPEALQVSAGLASAFAIVAGNPCGDEIMDKGEGQE